MNHVILRFDPEHNPIPGLPRAAAPAWVLEGVPPAAWSGVRPWTTDVPRDDVDTAMEWAAQVFEAATGDRVSGWRRYVKESVQVGWVPIEIPVRHWVLIRLRTGPLWHEQQMPYRTVTEVLAAARGARKSATVRTDGIERTIPGRSILYVEHRREVVPSAGPLEG